MIVRVLFTEANTYDEALAAWHGAGSSPAYSPARHRVVVGWEGEVLKDNTGQCTNDEGKFVTPNQKA